MNSDFPSENRDFPEKEESERTNRDFSDDPTYDPGPYKSQKTGLYVIQDTRENYYYTCSSDPSCGWNDDHPKQAWSKSEMVEMIAKMVHWGHWPSSVQIIELEMPVCVKINQEGQDELQRRISCYN